MADSKETAKNLKNIPNVKLSGTTFNSAHLDNFLKTEYGEKMGNIANFSKDERMPEKQPQDNALSNVRYFLLPVLAHHSSQCPEMRERKPIIAPRCSHCHWLVMRKVINFNTQRSLYQHMTLLNCKWRVIKNHRTIKN